MVRVKKLICPKCHRSVTVTDTAKASCEHGKRASRLNPPVVMVPIEKLGI